MSIGSVSSTSFASNLISQEIQSKAQSAAAAIGGGGRNAAALAAILGQLVNNKFDQAKNAIEKVGQSGAGGGADNAEMLKAQMEVGQFSAFSSAATNTMNTVNESQKEIGRNSR